MFKLSIFLLVTVFALAHGAPAESEWDWRIVGGSNAGETAVPWQVSLRSILNAHFCGGTIIGSRTILTAAHCVVGRRPLTTLVYVGTTILNGGTKMSVENIIVHPEYNDQLIFNDVAIVITSSDIVMSETVAKIPISKTEVAGGVTATLSGWGTTTYPGLPPKNLQIINLKTITFEECESALSSVNNVYETEICTLTKAGEGACHGDSGGPLTANGEIIGIVSWGLPCAKGVPDVFTRVSSFAQWIESNSVDN